MYDKLNWQWLQLLAQVADAGSFSKAAKVLNQSQPTLSRQIQQFETSIDQLLFHRTTQGLTLTQNGQIVYEKAKAMQSVQDALLRQLNGQDETLKGTIRISANEVIGFYGLPKIIAKFSKAYPEIDIEIVVTNQTSSLNKREADIALRMYPPKQPDLIAQKVRDLPLCCFASPEYLQQNGAPKDLDDTIKNHKLIGFDKNLQMVDGFIQNNVDIKLMDFAFRCDSLLMQIQLIQSGCGIGVTHKGLADNHDIVALFDGLTVAELPLWVVCHQEVKLNRRIRVFKDFLIEQLHLGVY